MTLDIHLANSEQESTLELPLYSFSASVHTLLFNHLGLSELKYPLFFRMKSYYSDTKYELSEVESLIKEIQNIGIAFIGNKQFGEELNKLKSIFIIAKKENLIIWVYCD